MGRLDRVQLGHHLRVVVVLRVLGREIVDLRRDDPEATQGERPCLVALCVQHDVVGPGGLTDVVPLGLELGALLARVHAVENEGLDRRAGRGRTGSSLAGLPRNSSRVSHSRPQQHSKSKNPPDNRTLQHACEPRRSRDSRQAAQL